MQVQIGCDSQDEKKKVQSALKDKYVQKLIECLEALINAKPKQRKVLFTFFINTMYDKLRNSDD